MLDLFLAWMQNTLNVSDDILFVFAAAASIMILNFLLDFFRFIMYYVGRGGD